MPLQVVHSPEETPATLTKSVFLAGPSPRKPTDPDWRTAAVRAFVDAGYDGTLFLPVPRDGQWPEDYTDQLEWEQRHLRLADVAAVWCPRDLETLPGFTTNVEFGELLETGKLIYGRPPNAAKTRYLDERYRQVNERQKPPFNEPCESLEALVQQCLRRIGDGAVRVSGERQVPLNVWRSRPFQAWYRDVVAAGNRLDGARVLWTFHIPQADHFLLCYSLHVKVWVAKEQRHKENEFVLSRTDIASICAYSPDARSHETLDTKVVLVREFRSPGRTADGFLHELPGGSSFSKQGEEALQVAADELKSETGLDVPSDRFRTVALRQMAGPFGSHKCHLFAVELEPKELEQAERAEREKTSFGVGEESEKTYVEVRTVREILDDQLVDHANVGMIFQACLGPWLPPR